MSTLHLAMSRMFRGPTRGLIPPHRQMACGEADTAYTWGRKIWWNTVSYARAILRTGVGMMPTQIAWAHTVVGVDRVMHCLRLGQ